MEAWNECDDELHTGAAAAGSVQDTRSLREDEQRVTFCRQEATFQTPLALFRFYSVLFGDFQWYYICLIINFSISDRKEIQS